MFGVFAITMAVLIGLLYATAFIPAQAVEDKLLASAVYLEENESLYYSPVPALRGATIDNYADSVLFQILYQVEAGRRFSSLIEASYYRGQGMDAIASFKTAIVEGIEPNYDYDRYWHGMMIVLRPLFVFFSIVEIRWIAAILLGILILLLMRILFQKNMKIEGILFLAGFVLVSGFVVPFCVEYMMAWFLMLATTLLVIRFEETHQQWLLPLFVISGTCMAFFDFLTAETLGITIPLILLCSVRKSQKRERPFRFQCRELCRYGIAWVMSYAGTFLVKWTLSSLLAGENRLAAAVHQGKIRMGGAVGDGGKNPYFEAVFQNVADLTIFVGTKTYQQVIVILCCLIFFGMGLLFFYHISVREWGTTVLLFLLALVPLVRFLVLHNHSLLHHFFTNRALLATWLGVTLGIRYGIAMGKEKRSLS